MSIQRDLFREIGGFDTSIVSSEDQDLALRHTALGGKIVFLPEVRAIHRDSSLDIRSYCGRSEWGMENMIAFCMRHADWPDNVERHSVNGPLSLGREPLWLSTRKMLKSVMTLKPLVSVLLSAASLLERVAPDGAALDRLYRLLLGIHVFKGYRRGLKRHHASIAREGLSAQDAVAGEATPLDV